MKETVDGFSIGKEFNSPFGYIELPSDILQVGIFNEYIEFTCIDGVYHVEKCDFPEEGLKITKVFSK